MQSVTVVLAAAGGVAAVGAVVRRHGPTRAALGRAVGSVRTRITALAAPAADASRADDTSTRTPSPDTTDATGATAPRVAGAAGFLPALEGLRGLAALGVLTTHVAFVTHRSTGTPARRLLGRLDLCVAVFFAKAGFLSWRAHAGHARRDAPGAARRPREYLRSRLVRIMPAYVVLVAAAMLLVPRNHVNGPSDWLVNLTLTQIYRSDFLVTGLTHAWSLAVEMAYYLALPLLWTAMRGLRGEASAWRIPALVAIGAAGAAYPVVPWHALGLLPAGVNDQTLPPAFAAWFVSGMVLAELATATPGRLAALCRRQASRWGWWVAGGAALVTTTDTRWFTEGFAHPGPVEFSARTTLAALFAFGVLAPVVLAPEGMRFPVLESRPLQTLGRWSYGIFLWHLLVLHHALPVTRTPLWSGRLGRVWSVTVAGSVAAAAASHRWIEEPARRALEHRR